MSEELDSSSQGADVGADSVEVDVSEWRPLDVADPRLGDSHGSGDLVLRQAALYAQPGELIDGQIVERQIGRWSAVISVLVGIEMWHVHPGSVRLSSAQQILNNADA